MYKRTIVVFLVAAALLCGEEFTLSSDGVGPISVHTEMKYEGKGERLTAKATNNSTQPLPKITFCLTAATKDCLFEFSGPDSWDPGKAIEWSLTTDRKVKGLAHQLGIGGAPPMLPLSGNNPVITIEIVDAERSEKINTYVIPGRAATSTTVCSGSATAVGTGNVATANGNSYCNTIGTAAVPPQVKSTSIPQVNVLAIMPDGTHVKLWCQRGWRRCTAPAAGKYQAQADGNALWIFERKMDQTFEKIKYQNAGGW